MKKRILNSARLRQVPHQFSWLDQRLVREHYLERCGVTAWTLYLFLVIVGDAQGLSYYSDTTIAKLLPVDAEAFKQARSELIRAQLIAYEPPLYQVLGLDLSAPTARLSSAPTPRQIPVIRPASPQSNLKRLRQILEEHQ
ncbi:MAG: hypothetical protein GY737_29570 [Desulfobacteraceae bacterium]|nr:hypothetical protein [Desulfobacteraceae bacterium]